MRTRFEHSAGGVVVKQLDYPAGPAASRVAAGTEDAPAYQVVLASRRRRDGTLAWGLPKGLVEPGEDPATAAVREVREETGLEAEIAGRLGDASYAYVWDGERVLKTVTFFLMHATGGDVSRHDHEMEDVRWFALPEALRRADYASERGIIERAADALAGAPGGAAP